jgi:hypothetical protein
MKILISIVLVFVIFATPVSATRPPAAIFYSYAEIVPDDGVTYMEDRFLMFPFEYITKEEDIIIGIVQSVHEQYTRNTEKDVMNKFSRIQIEQVISGDFQNGDIITIIEWGDGRNYIHRDLIASGGYLSEGDRVMLFINDIGNRLAEANDIEYLLPIYNFHYYQGRIWLTEDGEIDVVRNAYFESLLWYDRFLKSYGWEEIQKELEAAQRGEAVPHETLEEFINRVEAELFEAWDEYLDRMWAELYENGEDFLNDGDLYESVSQETDDSVDVISADVPTEKSNTTRNIIIIASLVVVLGVFVVVFVRKRKNRKYS